MGPATDGLASSQRPWMRRLGRMRVTQGLEETALREQLLATGTGRGGANRRRPSARSPDDTERRVLRGAPAEARGPRVRRIAARQALHWGQASSARRAGRTVEQAVPEKNIHPRKTSTGRRRFAPAKPVGKHGRFDGRRDENAGDARTPAREAARGERTVAPCPRGAVHRCTKTPTANGQRRGVQPIGCR